MLFRSAKLVVKTVFMSKATVANGGKRQIRFDTDEQVVVEGDTLKFRQFTIQKSTLQSPFDNGWCDVVDEKGNSIFTPSKGAEKSNAAKASADKDKEEADKKAAADKEEADKKAAAEAENKDSKDSKDSKKGNAPAVPGSFAASKPTDK